MNHGEWFCELLTNALEREETELKNLRVPDCGQSVASIRHYYEAWIQVPLIKEALRIKSDLRFDWEKKRVDLCLLDGDRAVATYEIKPFFPIRPGNYGQILTDFEKQFARAKENDSIENYVVLVPWGRLPGIESWLSEILEPRVRTDCPEIVLRAIPSTRSIALNGDQEYCASVRVFRVGAGRL